MKTNKTSSARTNSSANNKPAGSKPLGNLTDSTRVVGSTLTDLAKRGLNKGANSPMPDMGGKGAKPAPSSAKPTSKRYI